MEEKNVYVLYEGDQWISNSSLVPMGVFDSWPRVMDNAMALLADQIDRDLHDAHEEDDYLKEAHDELEQYKQFRGSGASIIIKTVELNKLEEF